jgi:AraC-like DNA-binding protein
LNAGIRAVTQATVIFGLLEPFGPYLEARGVKPRPLFDGAGLAIKAGLEPESRVSLDAAARVLNGAAAATGDAALGVDYASAFPEGASGMIGHLMLSAPTVRDMLRLGVQFAELAFSPSETALTEEFGEAVLGYDFLAPGDTSLAQFGDFVLALMVVRMRRAAGKRWTPMRVSFAHRAPAGAALEKFRDMFGCNLEFDAARYEFAVSSDVLDLRNPVVLRGLQKTMLRIAERELEEWRRSDDLMETVRLALVQALKEERPVHLDGIAKTMGFTPRTLQWKLKAKRTTFEDVLGDLKEKLAVELLRDSELPMSMIANRLGFSEPSGFTRWSRRRFGIPPSEVRLQLRGPVK